MKGHTTKTNYKWKSLSFLALYLAFLCSTLLKIKSKKIDLTKQTKKPINNNMINLTKTNKTNNMNTNNRKAQQLAALIAEIVINKGTCFAGFTYNGKRRNLTLGAKMAGRLAGGTAWGKTYANGALVEHNNNIYLQGVPNNEDTTAVVKRFKLNEVENFVIG
jgi:hypothetical protein